MMGVFRPERLPIRGDAHVFISKNSGDVSAHTPLYVTYKDPVRTLPYLMTTDPLPSWCIIATETQRRCAAVSAEP